METFKEYKRKLLFNSRVIDIISRGDLSVDNCIDELEKYGYRITKKL